MILVAVFRSGASYSGRTGVVPLDDLPDVLAIVEPSPQQTILMSVFRQSGNLDREYLCEDRETAIGETNKLFRRMKEPSVRIWENLENVCDVRRPYGSSRGTREGKKIWGVELRLVEK